MRASMWHQPLLFYLAYNVERINCNIPIAQSHYMTTTTNSVMSPNITNTHNPQLGKYEPEEEHVRTISNILRRLEHLMNAKQAANQSMNLSSNDSPMNQTTINDPSFHQLLNKKPFVTLSYAQTLNGMIAKTETKVTKQSSSSNFAISSPESFQLTHAIRSIHDGILVGKNTMAIDNPRLNVRLWNTQKKAQKQKQPRPVVIDSDLTWFLQEWSSGDAKERNEKTDFHLQLVRANNLIVCCNEEAYRRSVTMFLNADLNNNCEPSVECLHEKDFTILKEGNKTVTLLPCKTEKPNNEGHQTSRLDLKNMLEQLREKCGIRSIMVEGGSQTLSSFLSASVDTSIVDCVCVTIAPTIIGSDLGLNAFTGIQSIEKLNKSLIALKNVEYWNMGCDCILFGQLEVT